MRTYIYARSLRELYKIFEVEPRFDDIVLDTEHNDSGPVETLFLRCAGSNCPAEVAAEIGRSGFDLRTRPGNDSDTTIVTVVGNDN